MPVAFPTPDELAAMPWHQRDRVLRRLRAYERAVGFYTFPIERTGRSAAGEGVRRNYLREWGESVRAEARDLAGDIFRRDHEREWADAVRAEARRLAGECA